MADTFVTDEEMYSSSPYKTVAMKPLKADKFENDLDK